MVCIFTHHACSKGHAVARVVVLGLGLLCSLGTPTSAQAQVDLIQVSNDPFVNSTSQHATQVEPDTFSFGSTVVGAFQSGRFFNGGSSDIGFATSTDGGATWTSGFLPGITSVEGSGPFDRVSDPSVAYDAKHDVWLIASLPIVGSFVVGAGVLVSGSSDGGLTWQNPVAVATAAGSSNFDKEWIACDNSGMSPFYGNCYVEYDDNGFGNRLHMSTSTDGGLTWTEASVPAISVIGGQPVTLPDGMVVVPMDGGSEGSVIAVRSDDGGVSYGAPVTISTISDHAVAGGLRTSPLPSAEVDGMGTVYVVWQDCRFRQGCASNDIVMSASSDGTTWSPVVRIPIDDLDSGVDHFIPGIAVDPMSPAGATHLGITYYYYPDSQCTISTCQLNVGFVSTADGGATWSVVAPLNSSPISLSDLASTNQGRMVGDYISTSFSNGQAFGMFAVANPSMDGVFDEATYSTAAGLTVPAVRNVRSQIEAPVAGAASDHPIPLMPVTAR
jgi:hypothetical protein